MASTVASSILRAGRTQHKLSHASAIRSVYTQVGTTSARTATLATAAKNGMRKPRVGVAGATGAVGIEMRKKLEERGFPMESLKLFAHPSEEGTPITFAGKEYKCEVGASPYHLTRGTHLAHHTQHTCLPSQITKLSILTITLTLIRASLTAASTTLTSASSRREAVTPRPTLTRTRTLSQIGRAHV